MECSGPFSGLFECFEPRDFCNSIANSESYSSVSTNTCIHSYNDLEIFEALHAAFRSLYSRHCTLSGNVLHDGVYDGHTTAISDTLPIYSPSRTCINYCLSVFRPVKSPSHASFLITSGKRSCEQQHVCHVVPSLLPAMSCVELFVSEGSWQSGHQCARFHVEVIVLHTHHSIPSHVLTKACNDDNHV